LEIQGSLDGLCGVYAIINSIETLVANDIYSPKLFAYLIRKMGSRLPAILIDGLSTKEIRKLVLAPSVVFCAGYGVMLNYTVCPQRISFIEYWQIMQTHIDQHGAGSIVLGLAGVQDHWTCVRRITNKSLLLLDSRLTRLYRRCISIDATPAVHHLRPKDTFLLTVRRE
jgi:hypothetical protein